MKRLNWLFFRATTLDHAWRVARSLLLGPYRVAGAESMLTEVVTLVLVLLLMERWVGFRDDPADIPGFTWVGWFVVPAMMMALFLLEPPAGKSFIYFQF